jgi:hypothetical protein
MNSILATLIPRNAWTARAARAPRARRATRATHASQGGLTALALLAVFAMLGLAVPGGAAHAQDTVASLSSQKPALEAALNQVEADRLAFQKDLAKREEACLERFFSASCMDKIRTEHMTQMRAFDLRREAAQQQIRDLDAQIRKLQREQRIAEREAKQQKQGSK